MYTLLTSLIGIDDICNCLKQRFPFSKVFPALSVTETFNLTMSMLQSAQTVNLVESKLLLYGKESAYSFTNKNGCQRAITFFPL